MRVSNSHRTDLLATSIFSKELQSLEPYESPTFLYEAQVAKLYYNNQVHAFTHTLLTVKYRWPHRTQESSEAIHLHTVSICRLPHIYEFGDLVIECETF